MRLVTLHLHTVLPIGEELNADNAPTLAQTGRQALAAATTHLVLDMAATTFVSVAGLRMLLDLLKHARQAGKTVSIAGLRHEARLVFDLTGADRLFTHFPTVEAAFALEQDLERYA
ncbi:MAG: STAS domain-containing protein [Candidatus Sericytochromatia bacterium]